jgi:hypothetical protein
VLQEFLHSKGILPTENGYKLQAEKGEHVTSNMPCAGSISGDNFDIPIIPQSLLRPVQSTAPSGPWLFPAPDQWGDKVGEWQCFSPDLNTTPCLERTAARQI